MKQTLTEQWKNGELDERIRYYFRFPKGRVLVRSIHSVNNQKKMKDWDKIECLDRVPQYDEYLKLLNDSLKLQRLQEQLNEANAIIKDMRPFIQCSMERQTFMRIINYEDKWGVK